MRLLGWLRQLFGGGAPVARCSVVRGGMRCEFDVDHVRRGELHGTGDMEWTEETKL